MEKELKFIQIKTAYSAKPLKFTKSKFGGLPYIPIDMEYPKAEDGEFMHLLAQINFSKCPALEKYPKKGILQFFLDINYEEEGFPLFKVIYHKTVGKHITDFSFLPEFDGYFPVISVEKELKMRFRTRIDIWGNADWRIDDFYRSDANEIEINGHKIGGYGSGYGGGEVPNNQLLLLQIDSEDNCIYDHERHVMTGDCKIMIGDLGTMRFTITEEDLLKLNFDNVELHWDCG